MAMIPNPLEYDRMSSELLIAHGLSPIRVTSILARVLVAGSVWLVVFLGIGAIKTQAPTLLVAAIAVGLCVIGYVITPGRRLASTLQNAIDALKGIPDVRKERLQPQWILAEDMRAGTWICRKRDFKAAGVKFRKRHGPLAGDPRAQFRLVLAFVKDHGSKMMVAFACGTIEIWNPRELIAVKDSREPASLRRIVNNSPKVLAYLLSELGGQKSGGLHYNQLESLLRLGSSQSAEISWAMKAAKKWSLVEIDRSKQAYRLSQTGELWLDATAQGYTTRLRQRRRSATKGGSVTNNFYGPSNYVQGNIYGGMSVNQNLNVSHEDLLRAMRQVLDEKSIPWGQPELADVRGALCQAVAKKDPGRAGNAIRKLRDVVEQLAIGVAGNAAYTLLTTYFK